MNVNDYKQRIHKRRKRRDGKMSRFELSRSWLFPVVWTILYILMGVASYLVVTSDSPKEEQSKAISVYLYQLVVNFLWSTFFFQFGWHLFSFLWLVLLWVLILITLVRFYRIAKPAGYLLIPYLLWVTFAGYLNFAIWLLN